MAHERNVACVKQHLVKKQQELPLESIHLKPLHLFYLMAIYTGDFDSKLHRGWYVEHAVFAERIKDLLDWGLITYNGKHNMTDRGNRHVTILLSQAVK